MKSTNQQKTTANTYSDQLLSIPTKICDGVFMADELISQDVEWLQMNQVTHIINCAGKHCKNNNKLNGVNFLTYEWSEHNIQNIIQQNVIGAAISFIEEAKKQCGSVLVHCYQSESRPFCILASYLMIRYQWNLFKTLEFLNSRKQDIELQPAFFQQLTSLHQKLQEKGLIKSRNWNREDHMSEQEIILTNTFLNSRKRVQDGSKEPNRPDSRARKLEGKPKKINWKQSMNQMHVYYPQTILAELNPKPNNVPSQAKQSVATKFVEQQSEQNNAVQKENQRESLKQIKSSNEQNVTKRWAQLRQAWTKQKENNYQLQNQSQPKNSRKVEKPLNNSSNFANQQREQKVSDRIQEKLNIIKNGYDAKSNDMMKRRDHTPITGKKIKSTSSNEKGDILKREGQSAGERVSLIEKKTTNDDSINAENKQNQKPQFYQFNRNSAANNKQASKFVKNNLIKSNDSRPNGESFNHNNPANPVTNASMIISEVKQMGNKSVLIVKPNQFGNVGNEQNNLSQSRSSKRKISENDKENRFSLNKDTSLMRQTNDVSQMRNSKVSNFFRVDPNSKNNLDSEKNTKRADNSLTNNGSRVSESLQSNKPSSLSKKGSSTSAVMTKMRSSSTRVSRKQEIPSSSNTSISKNLSYTGKGKWKM